MATLLLCYFGCTNTNFGAADFYFATSIPHHADKVASNATSRLKFASTDGNFASMGNSNASMNVNFASMVNYNASMNEKFASMGNYNAFMNVNFASMVNYNASMDATNGSTDGNFASKDVNFETLT